MKHTHRILALVIGLGAVATATAAIHPHVGDRLYFSDWQSGQPGGSVLANPTAGSNFDPFRTFCVEIEENVYVNGGPGLQYKIAGIGYSTQSGGKTLSEEAAWLYTRYRTNTLPSYNEALVADRNALQYGIWHAMGYTDGQLLAKYGAGFQNTINAFNNKSWAADFANSDWSGTGNVRIANLVWGNSHQGRVEGDAAQDQLVLIPAPGAALLGALGVGLAGWLKRRLA